LTATARVPKREETMDSDEPRTLPELSPEEVGARVSAILEAAERDARAVISAAYREQPAPEAGLDELVRQVALLATRVEALEHALSVTAPEVGERAPQRAADAGTQAARMRAVELALAGLSREAIAKELSGTLPPAELALLLDDVLSG